MDKAMEAFTKRLSDTITFAIDNSIPPVVVIGMLETVKVDIATKLSVGSRNQPGQQQPEQN